jgi:frataxin-like iron-binding protein CyaY
LSEETNLSDSFDRLVEGYFEHLARCLEKAGLDVDFFDLTLSFPVDSQDMPYLMKVHRLRQEIWLSSPVSGGKRFSFFSSEGAWKDTNKCQTLEALLYEELNHYPLDLSL